MGRTEPARLCRREMAARLDLEMNPSSPRPPIPGLAVPAHSSAPAAIPLRGTALLLAPRQSRSHGPTATPTSPQPPRPLHSHVLVDKETPSVCGVGT